MIYLTPTSKIIDRYKHSFGMFETIGSYHNLHKHGFSEWAGDNGRFPPLKLIPQGVKVNPKWTVDEWIKMLDHYPDDMRLLCRFMVVPDVPFDKAGTLEIFDQYLPMVKERGYPAAFVTQDGVTMSEIPWNKIDALFIGGSDDHKLGRDAAALSMEAHRRNKWVHVGRVNSIKRLKQVWWADSVDGTTLAHNSGMNRQRLLSEGVAYCRAKKNTRRLL